jgi:hypothetical protein
LKPVTLETWNIGQILAEVKFVAQVMTSSWDWTIIGILRQPGDFNILFNSFIVSWRTLGGHMSIFVTTTNTGTLRAKAKPRCSFVIPTIPALDPIISMQKSGACPVIPNIVVFKYLS